MFYIEEKLTIWNFALLSKWHERCNRCFSFHSNPTRVPHENTHEIRRIGIVSNEEKRLAIGFYLSIGVFRFFASVPKRQLKSVDVLLSMRIERKIRKIIFVEFLPSSPMEQRKLYQNTDNIPSFYHIHHYQRHSALFICKYIDIITGFLVEKTKPSEWQTTPENINNHWR